MQARDLPLLKIASMKIPADLIVSPLISFFFIKESGTSAQKESSLENRPLLIMLPRGPSLNLTQPKRSKFWQHQLAGTGRVVKINILDVEKPEDFAVSSFLENVIGGTRSKISLVC